MMAAHPEITGRAIGNLEPLAVTFRVASQVTGLGATTLWKYAKEGRIRVIHPPGLRRTLIDFASLKKLFALEKADFDISRHVDGRAGRLRKVEP
jgi:hypothetical protein